MNEIEIDREDNTQPLLDKNSKNQMIEYIFEQSLTQIDSLNNILLSLSKESSINCKTNLLLLKSSMNNLTSLVHSLKNQIESNSPDLQFKFKLLNLSSNLYLKYMTMKELYHKTTRYFITAASKEDQLTKRLLDNSSEKTEAQSKGDDEIKGTKLKFTEELKEVKLIDDYFIKTSFDINVINELCDNKPKAFDNNEEDAYLIFDITNNNNEGQIKEGFKWNSFIIMSVLGTIIVAVSIYIYLKYCVTLAP